MDKTVGIQNWRDEYTAGPDKGVLCGISIFLNANWITKYDGAENTSVEGVKGGISSAFKRASVKWGIGRYLYDIDRTWVPLDDKKKPKFYPEIPRAFLPLDADEKGEHPGSKSKAPPTPKVEKPVTPGKSVAKPETKAVPKAELKSRSTC